MSHIASQVQKVRKLKKISQAKAAKAIGRTQGAYSNRETGTIAFSDIELAKLAELLGVDISVFRGTEIPESLQVKQYKEDFWLDTNKSAVNSRFVAVMRRYMSDHGLRRLRELAPVIHLTENALSAIQTGHQNVSFPILCNAVQHCGFNANYVVAGQGEYFISKLENGYLIAP